MNEFLQQFVIESRELVAAASEGLLALEHSPRDSERLDEVFRALHTLKGSAAIMEFPAMESLMHAAESTLSEARAGTAALTSAGVGECLSRLDQVTMWLETIERSGALPQAATDRSEAAGEQPAPGAPPSPAAHRTAAGPWLAGMRARYPQAAARALTAIRFVPDAECLYRHDDPLARMLSLPGLLALELQAREPWGPLDTLDPFRCNLILTALAAASPAQAQAHLAGHAGHAQVVAAAGGDEPSAGAFPPAVVEVLQAQQALLGEAAADAFAGTVGAAGAVAANALRSCGRLEPSAHIARATEQSLRTLSIQPLRDALEHLLTPQPPAAAAATDAAPAAHGAARTVRIDADQIDDLVRLTGELTVVKNAIAHVARLAPTGDRALATLLQERHGALERLVGELQRAALRMRVRPLRAVLQRLPRLVREMSASLDKPVRLVIEGEETEADRTIVEMLFEPLLHLVRNAIDHGVEDRAQRAAAGKPDIARLAIRAERRDDQIRIEISDDGAGIDPALIRKVALARGLVTQAQLPALTDAEALELIFAPGFSTAGRLTGISGRGVGMDAVRSAVERIGGRVSVASVYGQGTSVTLSLPFSVMMTHVMTVEAAGQMFGLPLDAIIETVRVPQTALSRVGTAPVVVLRDRALPVIDLAGALGLQAGADGEGATLVVVTANGDSAAFRVDRIVERLDLILKPLEGLLAGTPAIMGTSLLGDGRVLLVLDIAEMLH